ncbi:MAG: hypothetical protein R3F60_29375 [bacterium]
MLVLLGAALATLGAALTAADRRSFALAAGLTALVTAGGLWQLTPPGPEPGSFALPAEADGLAVVTRVVVGGEGEARRQVFAVALSKPLPTAPVALGVLAGLGLLGLWLGRRRSPVVATVLPLGAAAGVAWLYTEASGAGAGEPAVRLFLERALAGVDVQSFTVPEGGWRYAGQGLALAAGAAAVLMLPGLVRALRPAAVAPAAVAQALPVGAAVATVGAGLGLLSALGPWWLPVDGATVGAALALGGAVFVRERPAWSAALVGIGGGLAALAAGLGS